MFLVDWRSHSVWHWNTETSLLWERTMRLPAPCRKKGYKDKRYKGSVQKNNMSRIDVAPSAISGWMTRQGLASLLQLFTQYYAILVSYLYLDNFFWQGQVSYPFEIISKSLIGICKKQNILLGCEWENLRFISSNGQKTLLSGRKWFLRWSSPGLGGNLYWKVFSEVPFPRYPLVNSIAISLFTNRESAILVFTPWCLCSFEPDDW